MVRKVRHFFKLREQSGSAALITTIAISAILVVLFVGITTIATREIQQSISSDNASRALYGAEAGVEDAVRILANDAGYRQNTCNEVPSNPSENGKEVKVAVGGSVANPPDVAWTCRTVTTVSDEITGRLQKDESLQLNLALGRSGKKDTDPFLQADYMTIEWNDPRVDATVPWQSAQTSYLPQFSGAVADWNNRAAALEISAAWLDAQSAPGGRVQIKTSGGGAWTPFSSGLNVFPVRTVLASPNCSVAGCQYDDFSPWNDATYPASPLENSPPPGVLKANVTAKCTNNATATYNCNLPASFAGSPTPATAYDLKKLVKTEINNGTNNVTIDDEATYSTKNVILRIKPRYAAASYRMKFYKNNGGTLVPVYLPDGYATIDVTARSGNYFRRVVAKKQITPGTYDGIFDTAMFSGGDICKTMSVYRDFRGAPDKLTGGGPNDNAGRNTGCPDTAD